MRLPDFEKSRISWTRPISSYSKVQEIAGNLIRNRRFQLSKAVTGFEYLNVGCGPFPAEGFCNVDYAWRPGVLVFDITKGLPFPSASLKGIFTEHCLEHIDYEQCLDVLRDFRRMLKPGGVARIVVPDGELYCDLYARAKAGEAISWPYPVNGKPPIYYVNQIIRDHGHKFIYDSAAMKEALLQAGFSEARPASFRRGLDPKLLIDQQHRAAESLYIEGIA